MFTEQFFSETNVQFKLLCIDKNIISQVKKVVSDNRLCNWTSGLTDVRETF
jgi:hypothetical protein